MAAIIKDGMLLKVGIDFVDAVTGAIKSRGVLRTKSTQFDWQSTLPINTTESALRHAAKQDGVAIVYFQSQAI